MTDDDGVTFRGLEYDGPFLDSAYGEDGNLKFALYFDGGTERKLQIKAIRKDLCTVHATWRFDSAPLEQSISS